MNTLNLTKTLSLYCIIKVHIVSKFEINLPFLGGEQIPINFYGRFESVKSNFEVEILTHATVYNFKTLRKSHANYSEQPL